MWRSWPKLETEQTATLVAGSVGESDESDTKERASMESGRDRGQLRWNWRRFVH